MNVSWLSFICSQFRFVFLCRLVRFRFVFVFLRRLVCFCLVLLFPRLVRLLAPPKMNFQPCLPFTRCRSISSTSAAVGAGRPASVDILNNLFPSSSNTAARIRCRGPMNSNQGPLSTRLRTSSTTGSVMLGTPISPSVYRTNSFSFSFFSHADLHFSFLSMKSGFLIHSPALAHCKHCAGLGSSARSSPAGSLP